MPHALTMLHRLLGRREADSVTTEVVHSVVLAKEGLKISVLRIYLSEKTYVTNDPEGSDRRRDVHASER